MDETLCLEDIKEYEGKMFELAKGVALYYGYNAGKFTTLTNPPREITLEFYKKEVNKILTEALKNYFQKGQKIEREKEVKKMLEQVEMHKLLKSTLIKHVYFLKRNDGCVKIGFTTDINRRIKDLENGGGHNLEVLLLIKNGSTELEYSLHKRFKEFRTKGEWFNIPPNLLLPFIEKINEYIQKNETINLVDLKDIIND